MIDIDDYARRAVAAPIAQPPQMETVTRLATRQRHRRRLFRTSLVFALVALLGVGVLTAVSPRHRRSQIRVHSPAPTLGLFYPVIDQTDRTVIVLPSGHIAMLSGGLRQAIGGLGAAFWGTVTPKATGDCCGARFNLYHGAPGDLFDTFGSDAISTPVLVTPDKAKLDELKRNFRGDRVRARYALLSTSDWTLVAIFSDEDNPTTADAALLRRLDGWRLRATQNGAVVELPAGSIMRYSAVIFGRSGTTGRRVTLDEDCIWSATRTVSRVATGDANGDRAAGRWCEHGLGVEVEGPRSYVDSVVANLKINFDRSARVATSAIAPTDWPECDPKLPKTFGVFDHGANLPIQLSRAYYCRRIAELQPSRDSQLGSTIIVVNGKVTARYYRVTHVLSVDANGNSVDTAVDSTEPIPIDQLPATLQAALRND